MTDKLFREKALQNQRAQVYGQVLLSTPFSYKILTTIATILALLIVALLLFGQYARKERVTGQLIPDQGVVKVYATAMGIIKNSLIKEGQNVQAGDILFIINTEKYTNNNEKLNDEIKNELLKQQANIKTKIKTEKIFNATEQLNNSNRIKSLKQEIINLEQQIGTQKKLLQISRKQVEEHQDFFNRKLVLTAEVENKQVVYLQTKTALETIQRTLINKKNELSDAQRRTELIPHEKDNKLLDLKNRQSQISQQLTEIQGSQAYIIRAPRSGIVTSVQLDQGQQVRSNDLLLAILPQEYKLHAELYVTSKSIGFIEKGKRVLLRYDAYPYQRYGLYEGQVAEVAATALLRTKTAFSRYKNQPVYKIKIQLAQQTVNVHGTNIPLQSGMTVTADIIIENRSLIQWLLGPIFGLKGLFQ